MKQKFLTLAEVSDSLHTSIAYIKKLIEEEKIKAIKSSKNYYNIVWAAMQISCGLVIAKKSAQ